MIIPESLKNQKLKIFGKLTVFDALLLICYLLISFGIAYGLNSFGLITQFVVGIIVFVPLCCTLIFLPKQNLRIYEFIWNWFNFITPKKRFSGNEFQPFFNYTKIDDDCIVSQNVRVSVYTKAVEIQGLNINFLTSQESALKIQILQEALTGFDFSFSILKINQPIDLNKQIKNYENYKLTLNLMNSQNRLTQTETNVRWKEINNTLNFLQSENESLEKDLGTKYIIFVYGKNKTDCHNYTDVVLNKMMELGLSTNELDVKQTLYYCLAVLNPFGTKLLTDKDIEKYKNDLCSLFKIDNFQIKADCIETKDLQYHISLIYKYPVKPQKFWLNELFSYPNTCVIHSNYVERSEQKKLFEKALVNSRTNIESLHKVMDEKEASYESSVIDVLSDNIAANQDSIRETRILFVNYGIKDVINLQPIKNEFRRFVNQIGCNLNDLTYLQGEALKLLNFNNCAVFNKKSSEIPNSSLAWGFPFTISSLRDEKGFYLGNNPDGNLIFLDLFKTNKDRINNNAFILGKSGSGKSYTTKKILYDMLIRGYKVIVFDPEDEYRKLCKSFGGLFIDAANGLTSRINPLQILAINDEETKGNQLKKKQLIQEHLIFLEGWFLTLMPELNYNRRKLNYLIKMINELYRTTIVRLENIETASSESFPTFSNLLRFLQRHENNRYSAQNYKYKMHAEWVDIIKDQFVDGKFSTLYNGHSHLTLNARQFIVLNLKKLFESQKNISFAQAQLYLLLNFCWKEINFNRQNNEKQKDHSHKLFLVVDEAHTIIDANNPAGLDFLVQTVKRIRKYDGGVMLISQNPKDFVGTPEIANKTQSIVNNTQYNFIFRSTPEDIDYIDQMYHTMGGLTTREKQYIVRAKNGQGMLLIDQLNRHLINVHVEPYEAKTFVND